MSDAISSEAVEAAEQIARNTDAASKAMNGPRFLFQEYVDEQARVIQAAITKACADRDARLDKVKRVVAIADKLNEEATDIQVAVSSSLGEAMAYDVLEQTEKQRDRYLEALQLIHKLRPVRVGPGGRCSDPDCWPCKMWEIASTAIGEKET